MIRWVSEVARERRLSGWVTGLMVCSVLMTVFNLPGTRDAHASELAPLEALRWERRVILVFMSDEGRQSALRTLAMHDAALRERDVTWLLIEGDTLVASRPEIEADERLPAALAAGFQPLSKPLDVVLIGKDGGVKARTSSLNVEALLDQIDGMPMRRQEMRERSVPTPGESR